MVEGDAVGALPDHVTPLSSVDPGDDRDDLERLEGWFEDARVVGLGEATHGTRECFELRHRLTRLLVENCGFRTVALEAEAGSTTTALGEYVVSGDGDPRTPLRTLRPWYHTEGMAAFLRWLQEFNDGRSADDRAHLYGVDVGDPAAGATAVRSVLREADPDYYRSVRDTLDPLAEGEARERGRGEAGWFDRAASVARESADRIDSLRREGTTDRPARELARLAYLARATAGTCEWYGDGGAAEGFSAEAYEARDRAMADNAARLARRHGKLVLWAHNGHVKRGAFDDGRPWSDRETAGERLGREFGDGYRPVGTDFSRGRFRAIDVSADGDGGDGFSTFEAEAPPPSSLAAHLAELDSAPLFLDLATAGEDPRLAGWLDRPRRIRNVEAAYDPGTDHGYYAVTDLAASFDGVVFLDRPTPARPTDPPAEG